MPDQDPFHKHSSSQNRRTPLFVLFGLVAASIATAGVIHFVVGDTHNNEKIRSHQLNGLDNRIRLMKDVDRILDIDIQSANRGILDTRKCGSVETLYEISPVEHRAQAREDVLQARYITEFERSRHLAKDEAVYTILRSKIVQMHDLCERFYQSVTMVVPAMPPEEIQRPWWDRVENSIDYNK